MRIDNYLVSINRFSSRTKAKEAVERGEVLVNGKAVKPSFDVCDGDSITYLDNAGMFVSNGAFKLERAFEVFSGFNVEDKVCLDIGASTGGFTQSLLLHGAKRVFAVDVGQSLLNEALANDSRVVVMDNTNARYINRNNFDECIDRIVSDVSFISLTYILPNVYSVLSDGGEAVLLIKPQFECGPKYLSKNGIVTDKRAKREVCLKIAQFSIDLGFGISGFNVAPIKKDKNAEFLIYLKKRAVGTVALDDIACFVNSL